MYTNRLEFAKIISDFMFYFVDDPEEKAKKIFEFKHTLDARGHGFEKYIQYYFQIKKYNVNLNGGTWQQDDGIDLIGEKVEKGIKKKLIVQCKKHNIKDISYNDVAHFYGKIVDKYNEDRINTDVYYITTTKFTKKALEFLQEKGIHAVDFFKIYKALEIYPLEKFRNDLEKNEGNTEIALSFEKQQIILDLDDEVINSIHVSDRELLQFLKQVRRDISANHQLRLGNIAKNDTLALLARIRPHNFQALKQGTKHLSVREQNKMNKYAHLFIERLKYIQHS